MEAKEDNIWYLHEFRHAWNKALSAIRARKNVFYCNLSWQARQDTKNRATDDSTVDTFNHFFATLGPLLNLPWEVDQVKRRWY